jgi:hypothetical protein
MFLAPCIHGYADQNLDDLMLAFGHLWRKAEPVLAQSRTNLNMDEIYNVETEIMALNGALSTWQNTRVREIMPKEIGHVSQERAVVCKFTAGYWPGRVDTYFDLYTAAVWNISRTARLLLIFLELKLSDILRNGVNHNREHEEISLLIQDMIASIPYHLTEDTHGFLQRIDTSERIVNVGRSVGGLLLMHPIYITSRLSMVPLNIRKYLKECLAWIGMHMGIGQAFLYSKVRFLLLGLILSHI